MPLNNLTADALDKHEPARVNNCIMEFVDLGAADGQLQIALESFPLPKRTLGIIEAGHLNEKRKFAGNPVYEDIAVIYKDLVTADIARIIEAWFKSVHDPETGKTGFALNYKKSGSIISYAPDGTLERQWNISGVWPSAFDPGDADMSGEDFLRINVTFTIDKAKASNGIAAAA